MSFSKSQLKSLKTAFQKHGGVFAYLFGSQAAGTATKNSDFDFAVMLSDKIKKNKRFDIRLKLISEISRILKDDKVEIVVLNDTLSSFFKFVIIKEGEFVFERDHSARVDFELKTMNEYYDFSPFLDLYNQAYLKRELAAAK
jgi:uncharacterized protein